MKHYILPYFKQLDITALEVYYRAEAILGSNRLDIDLNFENSAINEPSFENIKKFLENIESLDKQNKSFIDTNFKEKGEAFEYINFYFDEIGEDELSVIIGADSTNNSKQQALLNKLRLIRLGLYPDADDKIFGIFDYSVDIDGEPCNQLLVVKTDVKGNVDHITWES